jgi:TolB-like protein
MVLNRALPALIPRGRIRAVAAALFLAACSQVTPPQPPVPADIPRLEQMAARSAEADARLRLAEAYRLDGRHEDAAAVLEPMLARNAPAAFFLALVHEDRQQYGEARRLYREFLRRGESPELRRRVQDRLVLLDRLELEHAVRSALAREQQLAQTSPAPRTVAVFPFLLTTDNPELRPLGTAIAELLTTDLAQTDRLTVLERAQLPLLMAEIRLGESDRVDPATAARGGRLLGAGSLVQGRVEGTAAELSLQAAVVQVPTDTAPTNVLRERDALSRIFELEKRLALGIFDRLGIQLTPAERQRVLRQPTANLQALLALGMGLEAQDMGSYAAARAHFARAVQLDPGFELARRRLAEAEAQARAEAATREALAQLALQEFAVLQRIQLFNALQTLVPDPGVRDAFVEAAGVEGAARRGTARIIISRPGGQ